MNRGSMLLIAALGSALTACNDGLAPIGPQQAEWLLQPAAVAQVTNELDAGPGSFRAAVEAANADPSITLIRFPSGLGTIDLSSAVIYSGAQSLRIDGQEAILRGTTGCDCDLLVANGGADLTLEKLTLENAPRSGVVVDVPGSATGDVGVALREVTIRDNGLYGLVVDDQAGEDGTGADSDAGILLVIASSWSPGTAFDRGSAISTGSGSTRAAPAIFMPPSMDRSSPETPATASSSTSWVADRRPPISASLSSTTTASSPRTRRTSRMASTSTKRMKVTFRSGSSTRPRAATSTRGSTSMRRVPEGSGWS